MNAREQQKKEGLVDTAIKLSSTYKKKNAKVFSKFIKDFYNLSPLDVVGSYSPEELYSAALSVFELAQSRKVGEEKLRVFNPILKEGHRDSPQAVIALVNDDMPFLVDSITAELSHQNLIIENLFHPILNVLRSKDGKINKFSEDKEEGGIAESYIYIQLEQFLPPENCRKLEKDLNRVLGDVRHATTDWPKVLSKMDVVEQSLADLSKKFDVDITEEAREFLGYIRSNNFTFLGYRQYSFTHDHGHIDSKIVKDTSLGILRDNTNLVFGSGHNSSELKALSKHKSPVMVSKLIDQYATVHRRVPLDAISIKIFDKDGCLSGQHLFVGLFTSSTYSCRTSEVPLVRKKVQNTLKRANFSNSSHDSKALEHVLEKYPRDELFLVSEEGLLETSMGILALQSRPRVALFMREDALGRYMSCLVYVPRERYDTKFREQVEHILEAKLKGCCTNFYTTLDDSPLARVLFTILIEPGKKPSYNAKKIEETLIEVGRVWPERLARNLIEEYGRIRSASFVQRYERAFSRSYQDNVQPHSALHDINRIEKILLNNHEIEIDLYKKIDAPEHELRLKVYHKNSPVPLSNILPVLENMGLRSISEMPYEVKPSGSHETVWIHDFVLHLGRFEDIDIDACKTCFEEAFLKIWGEQAEDDGLNELVLLAQLNWRQVALLRAYNNYLRQIRYSFSRRYIEQVLAQHPIIVGKLLKLFKLMHDPKVERTDARINKIYDGIDKKLQAVEQLDHDQILRSYRDLIMNTLRTNYFQKDKSGEYKAYLSLKLDSKNIEDIPLPRPHVEIYIDSKRVEGVHLRGGKIARGGIRWSDRHDDFRTEVLGLMKAQMVKNAVIVPVGSKGGFIVKSPPPKDLGREAFMEEGIACYKIFIQALLELTDNKIKGNIVRPEGIVCHDEEDPYLVVAADKGTATFSDIANGISLNAGFWLGDAFASGGSAGYDHKVMGITARGAWESVKRHFRESGKNIQKEEFTVIGVGDMGGDVFGNGVLLSKHIKLIGAFNHLHIFCDPNPDVIESYKERKRLFKARGGWDQYNKEKLSKGARIYDRSAKSLKLTSQIKKAFNIEKDSMTPIELMHAMLKVETELLWFGGIGTYIKGSNENHTDADDKNNDKIRVDAKEVRASVIGEGANLGMTQAGRIEYAGRGGRLNTDFIDNSAGVDCSDHEVNIKILLNEFMASGKMSLTQRNKLLEEMTSNVGNLVLRDNYQQTQGLTMALDRGTELMPRYGELIRDFEKEGVLSRKLEGLPDEEAIHRLVQNHGSLTRPELSTLLSYAKMTLYEDILESTLPDEEGVHKCLIEYFPEALHKYSKDITEHQLHREIIATYIANTVVNRMGPVFVKTRVEKTERSPLDVVRAFIIVVEAFGVRELWREIEVLDNKVPADIQIKAMNEVFKLIRRAATWILLHGMKDERSLAEEVALYKPGVEALKKNVMSMVPSRVQNRIVSYTNKLIEQGMPKKLAGQISVLAVMASACDIINIGYDCGSDVNHIASTYFDVGEKLQLHWLRHKAQSFIPADHWEQLVVEGLVDDFFVYQAAIVAGIVNAMGCPTGNESLADQWIKGNQTKELEKLAELIANMRRAPKLDLSMLMLAEQSLRDIAEDF